MGHLENLDIFEFLASVGKNAVVKATQGVSNSQHKQSKRSDITFLEDTEEYAHLSSGCSFAGKEVSFGGGWKAGNTSCGFGARKTHSKDNCAWREKKEDNQSGGWETCTSVELNSSWEKQDGSVGEWDKGTKQKQEDGWGDNKTDTSWGWTQGTDRDGTSDTGWGKNEESCKKGIGIRGETKGWGSSLFEGDDNVRGGKRDGTHSGLARKKGVPDPGGWERSTPHQGIREGWGGSVSQGINNGWGEGTSPADGWGKKKVLTPDGWESGSNKGVTQEAHGRSIKQPNDRKQREDKTASDAWERGAQEEDTQKGWRIDKPQEDAYEEATVEGTQNGWDSSVPQDTGGWGEDKGTPSGWDGANEQEEGTKTGWERNTINGDWVEDRGATEGWGKKKQVSASGGMMKFSHNEGTHTGWESSITKESSGGWDKGTLSGWESSLPQENNDGWGEGRNVSSGWGKGRNVSSGWGKTSEASASGGWDSSAQEEHTQNRWESSVGEKEEKGDSGGWGKLGGWEKHTLTKDPKGNASWRNKKHVSVNGWQDERKATNGRWAESTQKMAGGGWEKTNFVPGRWKNGALSERVSSGRRQGNCNTGWGEKMEGTVGGWEQSTQQKGWRQSSQHKFDNGWGSGTDKKAESGWAKEKDLSFSGLGDKKVGDGRNKVGEDNIDGGWGEKPGVSAHGGWKTGTQEEVDDGWGGSIGKKTDLGWGEESGVVACGKKGELQEGLTEEGAAAGWEQTVHPEVDAGWGEKNDDGWESTEHKEVDLGWGQETKGTACTGKGQGDDATFQGGKGTMEEGCQGNKLGAGIREVVSQKSFPLDVWESWTEGRSNSTSGGWEKNTPQGGDDGWGECTMEKKTNSGWDSAHDTKAIDGWGECRQGQNPQNRRLTNSSSADWSENPGADKRRSGTFGPSGSNTVPLGKRKGRETSDWKHPPSHDGKRRELQEGPPEKDVCRSVDDVAAASQQKGITCNTGRMDEKTNGLDKAKEGAAVGWQQSTRREADDGWGEKNNNEWGRTEQKEADSGWRQGTDNTAWKEKGDNATCRWGKGTVEEGTSCGWGNKEDAGGWEKSTQENGTHNGWESWTEGGSSNALEKAMAAKGASEGWEQTTPQGVDGGWGECTMEKNIYSSWDSACDIKTNDGWGEYTEGQNSGNRRSVSLSAADWSENPGADKRQSGTFGPSSSNTMPLGKRKGFSEGSETNGWKHPPNHDGAFNRHFNNQRPYQDGRPRPGKRFNNGYAGGALRDSASNFLQNNNRWPRLRTLISLPEYSDMDELYKSTNKILHHNGYQAGDRLNPDDERFVVEEVLAYHREKEAKLGCGLDYIMIDSHADHQVSCFWVVRTDGSKTDFSYWKCLENLFEVKYPYAITEAPKEGGKDGCVEAPNEREEAEVKDSDVETKETAAASGKEEGCSNVARQEEDDAC